MPALSNGPYLSLPETAVAIRGRLRLFAVSHPSTALFVHVGRLLGVATQIKAWILMDGLTAMTRVANQWPRMDVLNGNAPACRCFGLPMLAPIRCRKHLRHRRPIHSAPHWLSGAHSILVQSPGQGPTAFLALSLSPSPSLSLSPSPSPTHTHTHTHTHTRTRAPPPPPPPPKHTHARTQPAVSYTDMALDEDAQTGLCSDTWILGQQGLLGMHGNGGCLSPASTGQSCTK